MTGWSDQIVAPWSCSAARFATTPSTELLSRCSYEAYEAQVVPKLRDLEDALRSSWPDVGRVVLWHRVGELKLGEVSVVVAISSPHRPEAFEAARFGIDALKATVPIWKRETWEGGTDWGLAATEISDVAELLTSAKGH